MVNPPWTTNQTTIPPTNIAVNEFSLFPTDSLTRSLLGAAIVDAEAAATSDSAAAAQWFESV